MPRRLDLGVFGMTLGAVAGFFLVLYGAPHVPGVATMPIFVLTTVTTALVVAGGALGYLLVARPRPYLPR